MIRDISIILCPFRYQWFKYVSAYRVHLDINDSNTFPFFRVFLIKIDDDFITYIGYMLVRYVNQFHEAFLLNNSKPVEMCSEQ